MEELIPLAKGDDGEHLVDLKNVHAFLGVKSPFRHWVKRRIKQYDFTLDKDFRTKVSVNLVGALGRGEVEYYATISMAKELCMIENNEKGKQARKYFMDVEVAFKQQRISQPELSPTEWLMETAKQIHLQGQRLIVVEQELALQKKQAEEAKLKALALPGPSVSLKAETTRQLLNERINYYVASTRGKVKWDQAWKILYTKAVYRLSIHFNMFEKKIDQVEKKGKLDLLYALACEVFPLEEIEYKNIQETINEDNRE